MSHFSNLKIKSNHINNNLSKFTISPLSKGFGITLGNALRRTLLSSIPGASMFAIKLNKIKHEFSPISGISEDVTHVILNLKKLVVKMNDSITDEEVEGWKIESWPTLKLNFSGKGSITAADIKVPSGFEVVNKNLIIATSENTDTNFDLEIYVTRGKDFKTFAENRQQINSLGIIPTDSSFSPVLNVAYEIEEIKVSSSSFHEQLTLSVSTNGAMTPAEAVSTGAKILTSHLNFFAELSDSTPTEFFGENIVKESTTSNSLELENFGLSTRSYNGLKSAGIKYLSQLTEMTLGQLKEIDRLGSNSIKEIKTILTKNGLSLKKN